MAQLMRLPTYRTERGNLSVIEKELPFTIKRVFYIYDVDESTRGGHRHKKTHQAVICLNGSCRIYNNNGNTERNFILDTPDKCLLLEPADWHKMDEFTKGSVLLVLASEYFDPEDYIYERY